MEKFIQRIIEAIKSPREDVAALHDEVRALRQELANFIAPIEAKKIIAANTEAPKSGQPGK